MMVSMLQPGWLRTYIFLERFQGEQSVFNSEMRIFSKLFTEMFLPQRSEEFDVTINSFLNSQVQ